MRALHAWRQKRATHALRTIFQSNLLAVVCKAVDVRICNGSPLVADGESEMR